jgi:hypothetical protein
MSDIILGHTKVRDKEGNLITDDDIIFTPIEVQAPDDDIQKVKEEYYNTLKNF